MLLPDYYIDWTRYDDHDEVVVDVDNFDLKSYLK